MSVEVDTPEQFMGNEGTIEVLNRQVLNFYTEKFNGKPPAHVAARKEFNMNLPGNDNNAVQSHVKNFIELAEKSTLMDASPDAAKKLASLAAQATEAADKAQWPKVLAAGKAAAALAGRSPSRIIGADSVVISYPGFFETLGRLVA